MSIQANFNSAWIYKLSKTSGGVGTTITITGQALNTGTPVVKFGSKTATIVGTPTATTMVVKAPSQSGHKGKFSVTVNNGTYSSNKATFTYK